MTTDELVATGRGARRAARVRRSGASDRIGRRPRRGKWRWGPTIVGLLVAVVVLGIRGGHSVTIAKVNSDRQVATAEVSARKSASAVHRRTWSYINPLRAVAGLGPGRIDMGADFAGSGPVLALGNGKVTMASDHDSGPPSCWGRTCWPVGGIVVYRLSDGPLAGRYVYVAENISVTVRAGQSVRTGQKIATMRDAFPYIETGWASGKGAETLAIADGHQCPCGDPGGWSTIEGRSFASVLLVLGAPAEQLQPNVPVQHMPSGWPMWPASASARSFPRSSTPLSEGATTPDQKLGPASAPRLFNHARMDLPAGVSSPSS